MPSASLHRSSDVRVAIPQRLDPYLKRPKLEAQVVQLLLGGCRSLSLLGPGGSGKTRLAQELGRRYAEQQHLNGFFCDLSAAQTDGDVCLAVAMAAGLPMSSIQRASGLALHLRPIGPLLLILDNAEGCLDALRALLPNWLSVCTELVVIVTSRAPVGFEGEHALSMQPLRTRATEGPSEAEQLFRLRARQLGTPLSSEPAHPSSLQPLLDDLGGLPLAIELAAAQLAHRSLSDLARDAREQPEALRRPGGVPTTTTDSVEQCFLRSWHLLSPPEQATLAQLSVFPVAFTAEQATGVVDLSRWPDAPPVPALLARLVRWSLLLRQDESDGTTRFSLLHPIRSWARRRLAALSGVSVWLQLSSGRVNVETGAVECGGRSSFLTEKELSLLRFLCDRPGEAIPRDTLLSEVWGYAAGVQSRTLDTTMRTLRKKVDGGPERHLQTVRGTGYGFHPAVEEGSLVEHTRLRHARWHLQAASETWSSTRFTPAHRQRQRHYMVDFRMAAHTAAEAEDAALLEGLLRRGIHPNAHPDSRLADALARLGDTDNSSTRKVLLDAYMLALNSAAILKWTEDIPEDWPDAIRYSLLWCRADALTDRSIVDAVHQFEVLLELSLPEQHAWAKASAQSIVAGWRWHLGDFEAARAVLTRADLPFVHLQSAPDGSATGYAIQALLKVREGRSDEALNLLDDVLLRYRGEEARDGVAELLLRRGSLVLDLQLQDPSAHFVESAIDDFTEAIELNRALGREGRTAQGLASLARGQLRLGNRAIAGQLLDESETILRARSPGLRGWWTLHWLARVECALADGRQAQAVQALRRLRGAHWNPPGWKHALRVHHAEAAVLEAGGNATGAQAARDKARQQLAALSLPADFPLGRLSVASAQEPRLVRSSSASTA